LFQTQSARGDENGVTLGPVESVSEHVVGVFRIRASINRQFARWSAAAAAAAASDYRGLSQWVKKLIDSGVSNFQFYDGWLIELFFVLRLAKKFPHAKFLYNFHFALDWVEVFTGRSAARRFLRRSVLRALAEKSGNLILTAETRRLARLLAADVTHEILDYPVFAAFDLPVATDWDSRALDVLILPHTASEIPTSISLLLLLRESGLRIRIACNPGVWARGSAAVSEKLSAGTFAGLPDPIYAPLAEGRYRELLGSSRVIVLPYEDEYFQWGS
jgi:hypothetical protein